MVIYLPLVVGLLAVPLIALFRRSISIRLPYVMALGVLPFVVLVAILAIAWLSNVDLFNGHVTPLLWLWFVIVVQIMPADIIAFAASLLALRFLPNSWQLWFCIGLVIFHVIGICRYLMLSLAVSQGA